MSMQSLALIENWPVPTAAAAVVRADGTVLGTRGPTAHRFPLASVTKPLAAYAALVAYEEGAIELEEPAGPEARGLLRSLRRPRLLPGLLFRLRLDEFLEVGALRQRREGAVAGDVERVQAAEARRERLRQGRDGVAGLRLA